MAVELHREGINPRYPASTQAEISMWKWREFFPPLLSPVSLGEGNTPLVPLRHLPGVWVEDERANPTGSFKDRMASLAVSWAQAQGFRTVAVASTGNAAVATAAYAAAAGLNCVILAKNVGMASPGMQRSLREMGAHIHFTESWHERWTELERGFASTAGTPSATIGARR